MRVADVDITDQQQSITGRWDRRCAHRIGYFRLFWTHKGQAIWFCHTCAAHPRFNLRRGPML